MALRGDIVDDMLRIKSTLCVAEYHIRFSYNTKRGNLKERWAKIVAVSKENAEQALQIGLWSYNERKGFKAYSNVKILECVDNGPEVIYL